MLNTCEHNYFVAVWDSYQGLLNCPVCAMEEREKELEVAIEDLEERLRDE